MRATLLGICLLAVVGTGMAAPKVYRWVDARGQVHYSDRPAPDARDIQEVKVKFGATTESVLPSEDPALLEAQRVAACGTKRQQLSIYQNSVRLVEKDALGREREYSLEERELLVARTRGEIEQLCIGIEADTAAAPQG